MTTILRAILTDINRQLDWFESNGIPLSPCTRWAMFRRMLNIRLS